MPADLRPALKITAEGLDPERQALISSKTRAAGINAKSMLIVSVFLCGRIRDTKKKKVKRKTMQQKKQ